MQLIANPAPDEIEICAQRLEGEERFLGFLYDDANDLPVKAPVGNATIGFGDNVQAGWSLWKARQVLRVDIQEVALTLNEQPWYISLNAARRSVMLDVGFNDGVGGLLSFHLMIAAIEAQNWAEASSQCHVANPRLASRYAALAKIILTGQIGG